MKYSYLLSLLLCTLLLGCSAHDQQQGTSTLLPIIPPVFRVDLSDQHVINAINDYLEARHAPAFSQYDFMRIDLDNDGWKDALIYITAPYGQWCSDHGCTLIALHAQRNGFTLIGEIPAVRAPFYIEKTTQGWRDIIIRLSGRSEEAKDVVLHYNGTHYPRDAERAPSSYLESRTNHIIAFP